MPQFRHFLHSRVQPVILPVFLSLSMCFVLPESHQSCLKMGLLVQTHPIAMERQASKDMDMKAIIMNYRLWPGRLADPNDST